MRSLPFLHVCIYYFIMSIKSHFISYWLFLPTIPRRTMLRHFGISWNTVCQYGHYICPFLVTIQQSYHVLFFLVFIYRCMYFVMLTFSDNDIVCRFCLCSFIFLSFLCVLGLLFFPYYMFKLCHQQNNSFGYISCTCFPNNGQILFCILETVKTIDYG